SLCTLSPFPTLFRSMIARAAVSVRSAFVWALLACGLKRECSVRCWVIKSPFCPEKQKGRANPTFLLQLDDQCQYIRGQRSELQSLGSLKVVGGVLAAATVSYNVEADLLAINEGTHACALNSGDVDENVYAAIIRLNEAKTFGCIEELNGTSSHDDFLFK